MTHGRIHNQKCKARTSTAYAAENNDAGCAQHIHQFR